MVTNAPSYQSNFTNPNVGYANFSLKDGRTVLQLQNLNMLLQNGVSVAKKHPNFQIDGTYIINWQPTSKMKGFSYIILKV